MNQPFEPIAVGHKENNGESQRNDVFLAAGDRSIPEFHRPLVGARWPNLYCHTGWLEKRRALTSPACNSYCPYRPIPFEAV